MLKPEALAQFQSLSPAYTGLGISIQRSLAGLVSNAGIEVHAVSHRIKTFESFWRKIERKDYKDPFSEIEDICGARIV